MPAVHDLVVSEGQLTVGDQSFRCALGRSGSTADKTEGDGATPIGSFPLRRVLYRADRLDRPITDLSVARIDKHDGWCDDPGHPSYNQQIVFPFGASAEHLWRDDHLYDVVVVLGHNDSPVVPGAGSAIFMHVAAEGYSPTEGCVALAKPDLLNLLQDCSEQTLLAISA